MKGDSKKNICSVSYSTKLAYSSTFHQIDKGDGNHFDVGGVRGGRGGWAPKLQWPYLNITWNNAGLVYNYLADEHTPGLRKVDTKEAMSELTHAWSQRGKPMRKYKEEHAPPMMSFKRMWTYGCAG